MTGTSALRLAILLSGSGTTAEQILLAINSGRLSRIKPAVVIASHDRAEGILKTYYGGMRQDMIRVCDPSHFDTPEQFGSKLEAILRYHHIDLIGQYGWMPHTPLNIIEAFEGRMINQHPGPLDPGHPDFGGKGMFGRRVHAARMAFAGLTGLQNAWTEATAQLVSAEFDQGDILRTLRVPIRTTDTVEDLRARTLVAEHAVHIETLQNFADGTVRANKRAVRLVHEYEQEHLETAKAWAIKAFPTG